MENAVVAYTKPLIEMVADEELRNSLSQSFKIAAKSIIKIENFFTELPKQNYSVSWLATFFNSWKATHLKMLAIYGLSCRLQRLALSNDEPQIRQQLLLAGALNAETSYEDLGLDYEGHTHAELYDRFAHLFLDEHPWQLEKYCLPQAREFKQWIYQNMVVADIPTGLFANMFSEIYNHAEYTIALNAFTELIDRHYSLSDSAKEQALTYINAHVEDETEVGHFLVVVKALNNYSQATNTAIDYQQAQDLFVEYLTRLGNVMDELSELMQQDDAAKVLVNV